MQAPYYYYKTLFPLAYLAYLHIGKQHMNHMQPYAKSILIQYANNMLLL